MSLSAKTAAAFAIAATLVAATAGAAGAADTDAAIEQVTARNKAAVAAYESGDFAKMKAELNKAIALGEKSGIAGHQIMARTYVHLGVLEIDGNENRAAGVSAFGKALKIAPDIKVSSGMATKAVMAAFKEARGGGAGGDGGGAVATASTSGAGGGGGTNAGDEQERNKIKTSATVTDEKRRADAETRERDRQVRDELQKALKELDAATQAAKKEHATVEQLGGEKADLTKQLAELKARVQQLDKEKGDCGKQAEVLAKERADRDKLLTDGGAREKKEREAKEKLEKDKIDREKQLAEAKARIQQLEKEKTDHEKEIVDGKAREKKEREAKEKLIAERDQADARDKDRKRREDEERKERDKRAAGPDVPRHVSDLIQCAVPDDAAADAELFVHCIPRPDVKAKTVVFYYRPGGVVHYNSLLMEHTKKGWFATVVPADKVSGKALQYYVEVRDGRDVVAATNGKAGSPNIVTLRQAPAAGPARRTTASR